MKLTGVQVISKPIAPKLRFGLFSLLNIFNAITPILAGFIPFTTTQTLVCCIHLGNVKISHIPLVQLYDHLYIQTPTQATTAASFGLKPRAETYGARYPLAQSASISASEHIIRPASAHSAIISASLPQHLVCTRGKLAYLLLIKTGAESKDYKL